MGGDLRHVTLRECARALSLRPADQPRHPWHRLNGLMDGIYAITATLLVLEVHRPEVVPGGMGEALGSLWPSYLAYGIGFLQIAGGWSVLRRISAWCTGIDHYATMLVLGTIAMYSLTPFTTSVLASSLHDDADLTAAVRLMSVVIFAAMTFFIGSVAYLRRREMFRPDLDPSTFRVALWVIYTVQVWPLLALLLSLFSPQLALAALVVYFLIASWPIDALTTRAYEQGPG